MIIYNPIWWFQFYSALVVCTLSLSQRTPLLKHHVTTLRIIK